MQSFKIILLNLDRDTGRLDHMAKQCARAELTYVRQAGILGDDLPQDLRSPFFDSEGKARTTMKRGEIGCYASHLRAMKRIADGEFGAAALVMEDDLEINPHLGAILQEALQALPSDWDILRLSNPPRRAYVSLATLSQGISVIRYSKIPTSAGAYLLTPKGAQKFLELGIRGLTLDDDLRRPWFHGMETFGLIPPPIKAGVLPSTIDKVEAGRFEKGMSSRMERIRRGDHLYAFKRAFYNIRHLGFGNWILCGIVNILDMLAKAFGGPRSVHSTAWLFKHE